MNEGRKKKKISIGEERGEEGSEGASFFLFDSLFRSLFQDIGMK